MTHGDPRGPNIIPFGRRTLDRLRAITRNKPAPPERPWPFNALGPSPYHRSTLPPVAADRTQNGAGRTQFGDDAFHFRPDYDPLYELSKFRDLRSLDALQEDIENALANWRVNRPATMTLDLVQVLLNIVRKLVRSMKLPPR